MSIYDESKMRQKVVYPTKQTPSYADWALFEMGKELEAHGSIFDPAQDVIFKTATGITPIFVSTIEVTIAESTPTEITLGETTYTLTADIDSDAYVLSIDDTFKGYIFFYGDIEVDNYIGANVIIDDAQELLYGQITSVEETPGE